MQQISSAHAARFYAGNFHASNFLFVQLISVQVISRAGNCMQVIGSSKSDSGNFHAVKQSLPF